MLNLFGNYVLLNFNPILLSSIWQKEQQQQQQLLLTPAGQDVIEPFGSAALVCDVPVVIIPATRGTEKY